jgi:hypothetical protein
MSRLISPAWAVLGAVVFAAGCGTSGATTVASARATEAAVASPTASPAGTPEITVAPTPVDPCGLITQAEADDLAGIHLQAPLPEGQPPVRCVWPTPLSGTVAQVEIDVGDGAKKFMEVELKLGHALDPVPGLADEAYVEADTVFFRTSETWVAIHLIGHYSDPTYRQRLEDLAAIVLSRL